MLAVCAGLVVWQLFVPPALGLADNNDYPKLIGRACLGGEHPLFEYVAFEYRRAPGSCWDSGLITSAALPLRAALILARPFSADRFDMRWLGAVYGVMFVAAFAWLLRLTRPRPWAALAALLIFCSATYVPWFNSFYFDTASYVFLWFAVLASIALMLRETVTIADLLVALFFILLLETSKSQHTALALPLIACFWLRFGRARFPGVPVRIAATAAVAGAAAMMFASSPSWYQTVNSYNALFYQALPRSNDPAGDLAAIGIDRSMARYVGQHSFLPDSPMQNPREVESIGRILTVPKLASYYAGHPRIAAIVFRNALTEGSLQRVRMQIGGREYRLGNYEKTTGRPPEAQSHFLDFWTEWKLAAFGHRAILYAAWAAALLAILWILAARRGKKLVAPAAIWTTMLVLAAVLVMFDGVDTGRHLFLFNAMLDMTVCGLVAILSD